MRDGVTKMHERGQEPVNEHQPVFRAGTHRPLPWPGRELGLVALVPQRAYLGYEFSEYARRQTGDPPVADDHSTRHVPHHTTMINDREPDLSPLPCTSSLDPSDQ